MALKSLVVNLRPQDYDRVLAHVERLGKDPVVRNLMGEVSIASVGRMALVTGLDHLDVQHGLSPSATEHGLPPLPEAESEEGVEDEDAPTGDEATPAGDETSPAPTDDPDDSNPFGGAP